MKSCEPLQILENGKLKLSRKALQVEAGAEEIPVEEPKAGKIYRYLHTSSA
jgi:hypothetical protein